MPPSKKKGAVKDDEVDIDAILNELTSNPSSFEAPQPRSAARSKADRAGSATSSVAPPLPPSVPAIKSTAPAASKKAAEPASSFYDNLTVEIEGLCSAGRTVLRYVRRAALTFGL